MVWKLVKEVLKVGEATVLYPFVPAEVVVGFRGRPVHDHDLCMACAACAVACPSNALTMATDTGSGHDHLEHILWPVHLLRPL